MDEKRLEEIEARADEATPGPWIGDRRDGTVKYILYGANGAYVVFGTSDYGIMHDFDEEFIKHARQDIPDLIAALREAQKERGDLIQSRDEAAKSFRAYMAYDEAFDLIPEITAKSIYALIENLTKERDEAREVVIEADSMYNKPPKRQAYDVAKYTLRNLAGAGWKRIEEAEILRRRLAEEREKYSSLIASNSLLLDALRKYGQARIDYDLWDPIIEAVYQHGKEKS